MTLGQGDNSTAGRVGLPNTAVQRIGPSSSCNDRLVALTEVKRIAAQEGVDADELSEAITAVCIREANLTPR